ncbi:MAG TPA: hypothetical protein GX717_00515 [Clostridiaceae bacterium]|nr:hypothetical protein [Clostridiaceae bacterium]
MDFLEGTLLGPLWCDSDYENNRHRGFMLFLSMIFWVIGVHLTLRANRGNLPGMFTAPIFWLVTFILFMIVSPLLNFIYYDQEFPLRALILLFQTVKHASIFILFYSLIVPKLILPKDGNIQEAAMHSLNRFAEIIFDKSGLSNSTSGLVTTVILLLFAALVAIVLFVLVLIFLPILLSRVVKIIQRFIDVIFLRSTVRWRRTYRNKHPFQMFNPTEPTQVNTVTSDSQA